MSIALPIVLAVALIARLGYWLLVMPAADRGFVVDEPEYFAGAVVFASGRGFSFWDTFLWTRTPLYPAFLGFTFQLFGHDSLLPARLLQLAISLASIAVLYLLARRALGPAVALVSGLLAAIYLPFIILPYLLLGETLFILMFGLFLLAISGVGQRIRFNGEADKTDAAKSLSPAGRGLVRGESRPATMSTKDSQRIVTTDKRIGPTDAASGLESGQADKAVVGVQFIAPSANPDDQGGINPAPTEQLGNSKLKTQNSKLLYIALAGIFLGLATLVRGTALVYLPFAVFVLWLNLRQQPSQRIRINGETDTTVVTEQLAAPPEPRRSFITHHSSFITVFILAAIVTLAPWTVRNYAAYGHFIPTDTTAGYNFWLGANHGLDGGRLAGDLLAIPNQGARQDYAYARGFDLLRSDLLGFVGKGLKEMNDLWAGNFSAEERFTQGYTHGLVPAAHLLASITFDDTLYLLLVPLAIVGLFAAPRHPLRGYVVAWVVVNFALAFIFFAVVRFRLAVLFFLLPYAAWTLLNLRPLWRSLIALSMGGRSRSRQKAPSGGLGEKFGIGDHVSLVPTYKIVAALILIVAFLLANLPQYPLAATAQGAAEWGKQQHLASGDLLLADGDLAGAAREYNQADQILAETQTAQANLSVRRGDLKDATQLANAIDKGFWGRYLVLGAIARAQHTDPTSGFVNRVVRDSYADASTWAWTHFIPALQCDLHVGDEGQDMGNVLGFAAAEADNGQRYRWSVQPTASLRLCPASPTSATLTLRMSGYRPNPLPSPTINVKVAGVDIGSISITATWGDYRIAIPAAVIAKTSGGTLVELSSSTFVSSGSDPRLLGFSLAEARLGGK